MDTKRTGSGEVPEGVQRFFQSTPLLSRLCEQNGWLDEDTLDVRLLNSTGAVHLYEVRFEEILKEGSGCECGRNQCWGRVSLRLSADGRVLDARIDAGDRS